MTGATAAHGGTLRVEHVMGMGIVVDVRDAPADEGLSTLLTGPALATADAYATAAFAMGSDRGPAWTARLDGFEAFSILENGTALSTPGFPFAD